jgi:hypothetical protein
VVENGRIILVIAAAFIIVGLVAIVMGFRAPAEKHDLAVALEHRGLWSLGIGVAIAVTYCVASVAVVVYLLLASVNSTPWQPVWVMIWPVAASLAAIACV